MPFAVLPALIPDIQAVYDVYFEAFAADPDGHGLLDILFPSGFTSAEFRTAHADATLAWWHRADNDTPQYTFKCVDTASGDVVGMAIAYLYTTPRKDAEPFKAEWLEGGQRDKAERVLAPLCETRERLWKGKAYIYIEVCAVHPKHQGRGAGTALVQALTSLGDSCNLPVYLESSRTAVGLYTKSGFHRIPPAEARVVHPAAVLDSSVDVEVPLMARLPGTSTTSYTAAGSTSTADDETSSVPWLLSENTAALAGVVAMTLAAIAYRGLKVLQL